MVYEAFMRQRLEFLKISGGLKDGFDKIIKCEPCELNNVYVYIIYMPCHLIWCTVFAARSGHFINM